MQVANKVAWKNLVRGHKSLHRYKHKINEEHRYITTAARSEANHSNHIKKMKCVSKSSALMGTQS